MDFFVKVGRSTYPCFSIFHDKPTLHGMTVTVKAVNLFQIEALLFLQ